MWQPIETAPMRVEILVSDGVNVASVKADLCAGQIEWWLHTDGQSVWVGSDERGGLETASFEPTHWMPLPEPPA